MFFDILQNPSMANESPRMNTDNVFREIIPANNNNFNNTNNTQPVILPHNADGNIQIHEDVEESLSIMDKEKELIIKALKKHRGKRRDASKNLGISERTLYRKLKEYDIEDL
jgi:transcriptional regulator of acetoin/glycerol metabolism